MKPEVYELQGRSTTGKSFLLDSYITTYFYEQAQVVNNNTGEGYKFDVFEQMISERIDSLKTEFHNKCRLKAIAEQIYPKADIEEALEETKEVWKDRNLELVSQKDYCLRKIIHYIETRGNK